MSYVICRAGLSCVPLIGPLVGYLNLREIQKESADIAEKEEAVMAVYRSSIDKAVVKQIPTSSASELTKFDKANKLNGCIYYVAGMIGHVLSIAAVVGLVALGVLSAEIETPFIAFFAFSALVYNRVSEEIPPAKETLYIHN